MCFSVQEIKDIIIAVAALATSGAAIYGITSWRSEMKGKAQFDTARKLMSATYELRNNFFKARSAFISKWEFQDGNMDFASKLDEANAYLKVYQRRFEPVETSLNSFEASALEAEALWGEQIKSKRDDIRKCILQLNSAIEARIECKAQGYDAFDKEHLKTVNNILAGTVDRSDELSIKMLSTIAELEALMKPHLIK